MYTDTALALKPALMAARAGYPDLDPWQLEVLRARPRRLLLNACRQSGKTLCAGLLATHQALYLPGSFTVCIAVAQRQAAELVRVCRTIYSNLGAPVPAESENKLSLELSNGSRILAVPSTESTIRGLSKVSLLVLDEAARMPDPLFAAVTPFLAISNGSLALLSTPWGKRGFFYQAYLDRASWHYVEVHGEQVPRISAAFLAEQRRKTGEFFFAQEWQAEFNDGATGAFREADILRAVKDYPTWGLFHEREDDHETIEPVAETTPLLNHHNQGDDDIWTILRRRPSST
jgi:hypothetical protein